LTVRLIDWLGINARAGSQSALVVCIDIGNMNDKTRVRDIRHERRSELVLCCDAMEPDRHVADTDLAMDRVTFRISVDAARIKTEGLDQEIMSRRNVLVSQNRDYSLECRHEFLHRQESA
jgi:hypothetical protein